MSLALGVTDEGLDLVLSPAGLVRDESVGTSLLVSLLSDARARDEDLGLVRAGSGRRGWFADSEGQRFGSRLWLLERRSLTDATLRDAGAMASEALDWLVDEGVAARVSAQASRLSNDAIGIEISIEPSRDQRYAFLWRAAREGRFAGIGAQFGWRVG